MYKNISSYPRMLRANSTQSNSLMATENIPKNGVCISNSLNCARITIHKNFFFSFIINNTLWIIWFTKVTADPVVLFENGVSCRVLYAVLHYFLLSNYMWMFCEGLYLHTILVITFIRDEKIITLLYFIGWGLPVLFISIYVGLRVNDETVDTFCWIDDSPYKWALIGPVAISLMLNLAFLINIIRLLVTKVRSVNNPDNNHSRKAVRATLILIPLLGLNYILTPFRPATKSTEEKVYEVISAIATSFQGLSVSLLLCFFNSEVRKKVISFNVVENLYFMKKLLQILSNAGRAKEVEPEADDVQWMPQNVIPKYNHNDECGNYPINLELLTLISNYNF
ncbi:Calcitonin gene-related peptide type 1 receptor [Nymphon striatum]|nr:Calcitonin gene-related peptide type 1 receptor [Nymphon striatum]